ncbi:MAG: zonular occludens toxin domain-containing protein [Methylovulum miyakonense]|uniref:zonular occludens toxin family protein n=1 Tax=Methylovulum miyakonense TaxID=645578 RepID=UPI003BB5042E
MATRIHHGAPGSYKSFTLVQRFAIPALFEGRTVVTNIRGFNDLDLIAAAYPDKELPEDARIIWVDTRTAAARLKMACWFHWVPFGACIIIDEIQQIYPDRRDFKLESLDKWQPQPGDVIEDIRLEEGRPEDVFVAFDKQRHYNWDLFASTTNIAKVKKEIREVTEWAFRHRDLSGLLPWWKHTWMEHQHDPENNGKSNASRAGAPKRYKADPRVFTCYSSTATGEHTESKAGKKILDDPKVVFFAVVILACVAVSLFMVFASPGHPQPVAAAPDLAAAPAVEATAPGRPVPGRGADAVAAAPASPARPLKKTFKQNIMVWGYQGITVDEFDDLPPFCSLQSKKSVRCTVSLQEKNQPLFSSVTNKVCTPRQCYLYFPVVKKEQPHTIPTVPTPFLSAAR